MKNRQRIILIAVIIFIIILAIFPLMSHSHKTNKIAEIENSYSITYSASYRNYYILDNNNDDEYEVVEKKDRLDELLGKIGNTEYSDIFDEKYFKKNKVIVIVAGVDPEINKLYITDSKANIKIYQASPLASPEQTFDFKIYLIPISKKVDNISVELTSYPDRLY